MSNPTPGSEASGAANVPASEKYCHAIINNERHVCRLAKGHDGEHRAMMNVSSFASPASSEGPRNRFANWDSPESSPAVDAGTTETFATEEEQAGVLDAINAAYANHAAARSPAVDDETVKLLSERIVKAFSDSIDPDEQRDADRKQIANRYGELRISAGSFERAAFIARSEFIASLLAATLRRTPESAPEANPEDDAYEYRVTTGPRKAWDGEPDLTKEGWEPDPDRGRPGESWDRFDNHEEMYWRRRRSSPTPIPSPTQEGTRDA